MLMPPPPMPPFLPIYDEADRSRIQAQYELANREWQREYSRLMWLNAIPVICACAGVVVAAFVGPSTVIDAILILTK